MNSVARNTGISHKASLFFLCVQAIIIVLYGVFVEWGPNTVFKNHLAEDNETNEDIKATYPVFQDIQVMLFVGFGFLMAYLRKHSWNSVGVTFITAAFCLQLYFLCSGLWRRVFGDVPWNEQIHINLTYFVQADFAAAAVLISFGGVLGKISVFQMLFMSIFEVFFYALNEEILYSVVKIVDAGGTITIHVFGAYFGLAVSKIISKSPSRNHPENNSSYSSNLFALVGTLFLWIYWPSFNSALLSGNAELRAQISTILSLIGSTFSAFMISAIYKRGRLHMEDVLNATLAGGVVVGASASIIESPYAAFIVGLIAGAVSTFGFETLTQYLQEKIELYDTAGIHNLHGIPGVLGGFTSAIFVGAMTSGRLGEPVGSMFFGRSARHQAGIQIAGIFISAGIGIVTGLLTGLLLGIKLLNPPSNYFSDYEFWHIDLEGTHDAPEVKNSSNGSLTRLEILRGEKGTERIEKDKIPNNNNNLGDERYAVVDREKIVQFN